MGWSIAFDGNWNRDIGYGVPAICDHPGCGKDIDRGLGYVCGDQPRGGSQGCGLFFCGDHMGYRNARGYGPVQNCKRCMTYRPPFKPTPDTAEWIEHKLTDESWAEWRAENPEEVAALTGNLTPSTAGISDPSSEIDHESEPA